ncbi:MAG: hypothetical protein HW380_2412 [Magnetococcales bacterium]|nr:hypothetical protein [Magnetococcales bacterium]
MRGDRVAFRWATGSSGDWVGSVEKVGGERQGSMRKRRASLALLGVAIGLGTMLPVASRAETLEMSVAVAQALNNRPEVSQAIYATAAARERVGASLSDFLPTVNLRAANGREETDSPTTQATGVKSLWLNPRQRGITVSQNLFRGFGTTHQVSSSQANARSAAWKVLEVAETMAMRAVDSYVNVLKNRGQIRAAQESVHSHKALLELVQRRAESGAGTKADVNQSQARVKQAQAMLEQIKSTQDVAQATFEAVFGQPPGDLQEPGLPDGIVPKDRKEALKLALNIHPAIFSAQEAYFASKEQSLAQNSAFAPAVNLLLTANNDAHLAGSPGRSESMSAVVEMTVNAFSGYKDVHTKRESAYNMAQAQSLLDKALLDITENLANSYALLTAAKSRRDLFASQVKENEKVREAFFKQYGVGERTLLDLLDVENELFSARNSLVTEHYQELAARHRVLANMGQLLRTLSVGIPSTADPVTVEFSDSIRSLFTTSDLPETRWPAMEKWMEQRKIASVPPEKQESSPDSGRSEASGSQPASVEEVKPGDKNPSKPEETKGSVPPPVDASKDAPPGVASGGIPPVTSKETPPKESKGAAGKPSKKQGSAKDKKPAKPSPAKGSKKTLEGDMREVQTPSSAMNSSENLFLIVDNRMRPESESRVD